MWKQTNQMRIDLIIHRQLINSATRPSDGCGGSFQAGGFATRGSRAKARKWSVAGTTFFIFLSLWGAWLHIAAFAANATT